MSYKPLSQTVTDGQKNPISSDAVNDHVAAEISAIPASASLTLNNLTAPTAVNQDLRLDSGKILSANAEYGLPVFTQSPTATDQTDIFLRSGTIVSYITKTGGIHQGIRILSNAYEDNGVSKNLERRAAAVPYRFSVGNFGTAITNQGLRLESGTSNPAGSTITWTNVFSVSGTGGVTATGLSLSGSIYPSVENLVIGGTSNNLWLTRFEYINTKSTGSFGTRELGTGIRKVPPAGVLSSAAKNSFSFSFNTPLVTVSPHPNNSTTFVITAHPSHQPYGIGDYIQLQGLPEIRRIIAANIPSGSPATITVDGPMGDGTVRTVIVNKAGLTVYSNTDKVVFEAARYDDATLIDASLIVNESGADKDTRIEGDTDENLVFVDASADSVGIGTATPGEKLEVNGNIKATSGDVSIATAGKGLKVAEGSDATMGVATLVAGTVTVNTTAVKSNSRIMLTTQVPGGTVGFVHVSARTADTSFVITSSLAADTSEVAWLIINPA